MLSPAGVTLINKGVTGLKGNTVPGSQWSPLRQIHPPTINSPEVSENIMPRSRAQTEKKKI